MPVVNATEEFERWIEGLSHQEQKTVLQVVKILEPVGLALGEPYSSALKGTKYPLRELRTEARREPAADHLRVRSQAGGVAPHRG